MGAANSPSGQKPPLVQISDVTLYEKVRLSVGGDTLRIVLSNEFGTDPLRLDDVRVGLSATGSAVLEGTGKAVTFGGRESTVIAPGAVVWSDAVPLKVPALAALTVAIHLGSQPLHTLSWHSFANQTNYVVHTKSTGEANAAAEKAVLCWEFLRAVQVSRGAAGRSIVAFGDSITDGVHSTRDRNARWPDILAERISAAAGKDSRLRGVGVANEGIGGNRILADAAGPNGLARFDRDVLAQPGARYLIVLEGINDIGNMPPATADSKIYADSMIAGYVQMIERAHGRGMLVYGATLTPYEGAGYATPLGEEVRQKVNTWIRTSNAFDAVLDFDRATRDPTHPTRLLPAYDPGDHLHPNDAGYKAMADSIDLQLFR
jgi:lysophospholipase L1-like esterase